MMSKRVKRTVCIILAVLIAAGTGTAIIYRDEIGQRLESFKNDEISAGEPSEESEDYSYYEDYSAYLGDGIYKRDGIFTFKYDEEKDGYILYECSRDAEGAVTVPSVYEGKPVVGLAEQCFMWCENITEVTVPDSVESIGGSAFSGCENLETINLPDKPLEIGSSIANGTKYYETESNWQDNVLYAGNHLLGLNDFSFMCSEKPLRINEGTLSVANWLARVETLDIESLYIPASVEVIGEYSFENMVVSGKINVEPGNKVFDSRNDCNALMRTATNELLLGSSETVIPLDTYAIRHRAFAKNSLKSVAVPEGVVSIGSHAFTDCGCLESITLPGTIRRIGTDAFYGTPYIENEENQEGGLVYIGEYLIGDCYEYDYMEHILDSEEGTLALKVREGTRCIADRAFENNRQLKSVELPESLKYIGNASFMECGRLDNISIPAGVKDIGEFAFYDCYHLKTVSFAQNSPLTEIKRGAFYSCYDLKSVNIPKKVREIGKHAFERTAITSADGLSESALKAVGDCAFEWCDELKYVSLPACLEKIGDRAFYCCTNLQTVDIPDDCELTVIGDEAFDYCSELKEINLPAKVIGIGESAFYNCRALTSVTIPESVTEIGKSAFYECVNLSEIKGGGGITELGRGAFDETAFVKDRANFENGGLYVAKCLYIDGGNKAFDEIKPDTTFLYDCKRKVSGELNVPDNIKGINLDSFEVTGCTAYKAVPGVRDILSENGVWYNEEKTVLYRYPDSSPQTEFDVPDTVEKLYTKAFKNAKNLENITIPASVTEIESDTFAYAGVLAGIKVSADNPVFDSRNDCNAIIRTENNTLIAGGGNTVIPEDVTMLGNYAFSGCRAVTKLTVPAQIKSIGDYAYSGCPNLKSVKLRKGVKSVCSGAFSDCEKLEKIRFPESVEGFGEKVCFNCPSLTSIKVARENKEYDSRKNCNAVIDTYWNAVTVACKTTKIPDTVKVIGTYSYSIEGDSIYLPASITTVWLNGFTGCKNLKTVYYGGTKEQWEKINIYPLNYPLIRAEILYNQKKT